MQFHKPARTGRDRRVPECIEQRRFAMVDVAHQAHHRHGLASQLLHSAFGMLALAYTCEEPTNA
jgi:hypothetical protein